MPCGQSSSFGDKCSSGTKDTDCNGQGATNVRINPNSRVQLFR